MSSVDALKSSLRDFFGAVLCGRTMSRLLMGGLAMGYMLTMIGPRLLPADEPKGSIATSDESKLSEAELNEQAVQLLQTKCTKCHGAETAEAGLRLDSRQWMLKGGDRGAAVIEEMPLESLLWQSMSGLHEVLEMPPKNPMQPEELGIIEKWLQAGANWPESNKSSQPISPVEYEKLGDAWSDSRNPIVKIFGGQRLDLWSLKPVQQPALPSPTSLTWALNEVDRFVLTKFESAGVEPPKMADRHTLVRRLYFDLTGLPPSPEAAAKFEVSRNAQQSDEVEQLVDDLLNTEQFGQHWARMWLDVARYSDSNGYDWDEFRPQAWRYRDYVIQSLNADKPFDRFVQEQLAGDELFAGSPQDQSQQDALIATGFLRLGPHDNAAKLFNEQDRSRDELLTDLVETTGSALLGITLSCCRCHDHKHDPFSQADHFRMRAFFAGVTFADDLPIDLADEQLDIQEHNARIDEQISHWDAEQQSLFDAIAQRLTKERLKPETGEPRTENADAVTTPGHDKEQLLKAANDSERQALDKLKESIQQAEQQKKPLTYAMLMVDSNEDIPATYVLYQGDHKSPRQQVEPGILSALNPNSLSPAHSHRPGSSGRRLALAQWITSPDNPLTARVFVNRVWQSLMGRGLVATPGDFGLAGAIPDEPEMLDWLARRFVEDGWSIKRLVRRIVLSATYQQAATYNEPNSAVAHLTRYPRRLTAEQLRDSILAVSGLLTSKNSGPPEWPELPKDVLDANPAFLDDNETKTKGWYPSPVGQQYCRSIFLIQKRNTRVPILETFDLPENSVPCTRRLSSIVAPQALALLNSPEAVAAARQFADRVANHVESEVERIRYAFRQALQREPSEVEIQACKKLLQSAGWTEMCRVLLNVNEFAFMD
jgi:bacterioferritin (cytochrome b1)